MYIIGCVLGGMALNQRKTQIAGEPFETLYEYAEICNNE